MVPLMGSISPPEMVQSTSLMTMPSASSSVRFNEPDGSLDVVSVEHPAKANAAAREHTTAQFDIGERIMRGLLLHGSHG